MKPTEEQPAYSQQQTQVFLVVLHFLPSQFLSSFIHSCFLFFSDGPTTEESGAAFYLMSFFHGTLTDIHMNRGRYLLLVEFISVVEEDKRKKAQIDSLFPSKPLFQV